MQKVTSQTAIAAATQKGIVTSEAELPSLPRYALAPSQFEARMRDLAKRFPDLVEVRDIGDSAAKANGAGGHDLFAMVLTDKRVSHPKAKVAHVGAVHGSELTNPTLLTEFAEQIVNAYGRDPQATMLLREREIHLVPMLNPDGVDKMVKLLSGADDGDYGRKNANGVDLNRNFPFGWGGNGSCSDLASGNYRGPAAASESETQSAIKYLGAVRPNLFVDWHNAAQLVLHPWGETTKPGHTSRGLHDLAKRVATLNGYTPISSAQLYPTSGSTIDWVHGTLKAPALTVEAGDEDFLIDPGYEKVRRENMPVLWDLASIADHPITRSRGPVTNDANRQGNEVMANVTEDRSGGQAIAAAELVLNPATRPGKGIPLRAGDGAFGSPTEWVTGSLSDKAPKQELAYIRAKDARGNWGALRAFWLDDPQPPPPR